jgi:enoyl-CoA hydratase/carnithine racemase
VETEATGACGPFVTLHPDGVAEVVFDDPARPVNVLTVEVMEVLEARVASFHALAEAGHLSGVLFRSGKPNSFLAGADVDAMDGITSPEAAESVARRGQELFSSIARLPVPTVAAIHGPCVGGGTELALACDRRLVSTDPRSAFSLPEVRLGILPAWGGTTRLPALVGLVPSLSILLTGRTVRASEAYRIGLATTLLPPEVFSDPAAIQAACAPFLRWGSAPGAASAHAAPRPARKTTTGAPALPPPPARRAFPAGWIDRIPGVPAFVLHTARRRVLRETGGAVPAPLRILEILSETRGRGTPSAIARGLDLEAVGLGELLPSLVSRNLRHLFHLSQRARRRPEGMPASTSALPALFFVDGTGAPLATRATKRGLEVRSGPVLPSVLRTLPGGPERWLLVSPPEVAAPDALPDGWASRWVGLGLPAGAPSESPLLELVPAQGASPIATRQALAEGHAVALALGGVPILTARPGGTVSGMIESFNERAGGGGRDRGRNRGRVRHQPPHRDPEFLDLLRAAIALRALADGAFRDAGMVDLAMVMAGLAPAWEGGPLRRAEAESLPSLIERLDEVAQRWDAPLFLPPEAVRGWSTSGRSLQMLDLWGGWAPGGDEAPPSTDPPATHAP